MKQYTNSEQTTRLIELGFEKPKSIIDVWAHETDIDMEYEYEYAYSIGELIEILPEVLAPLSDPDNEMMLNVSTDSLMWTVRYGEGEFIPYETISYELIDVLYNMVIKLKEEGVI